MSPARKSRKKPAPRDLLERLSSLGEAGETGVLQVRPDGWPGGDVYLMGGEIIACGTDRDDEQFGRILISAGAISSGDLEAMRQEVEDDGDLADVLVASGAVSGAQVMESRQILFADNLAWTLSAPDASEEFVASDAVFPTNMQFGLERGAVLEEIRAWRVRVELVLREAIGADQWVTIGEAPEDCDAGLWEGLSEPLTVQEILERAGPPRRKAAERIAGWIATGLLMVDDGAAHLEAIDAEPPPGGEETDYEKAARGEFIKSYDVLDKVDLSGMAIVGTGEPERPQSNGSMEAIEAIAMDDIDDDDDHDDLDDPFDEDEEPTQAGVFDTRPEVGAVRSEGGGEVQSGDFEMFDEGSEDDDELSDVGGDFEGVVVTADDSVLGPGTTVDLADDGTPFTREQLNDFHERIAVFNNIFRIIFKTFASNITVDKSLERFNALLGSGQRQYPELFRNIEVQSDGSVATAPLINNLAGCPPGDYGSLLHQGLYELIFSHLYDAKDMLPGEAESEMMEQIVVFERQLHQM